MSVAGAVAAALGSAGSFGLASALQHEQARLHERTAGLLLTLVRQPRWLAGTAADVVGVVLQAVALGLGAVSLVQPLLVAGLPVAVALSAALEHRRLHRAEGVGLALCTAGLALLGPALSTTGTSRVPTLHDGVVAAVVVASATGVLLLLARRLPRVAPAASGMAAGVVIGAGSVLLAVCAGRVDDLPALFRSGLPYAALAVGVLGLALSQASFQTGALGAPLAALSVGEPAVAVVLAVLVLHERLPGSPTRVTVALVGTALAVAGVLVLSRAADDT